MLAGVGLAQRACAGSVAQQSVSAVAPEAVGDASIDVAAGCAGAHATGHLPVGSVPVADVGVLFHDALHHAALRLGLILQAGLVSESRYWLWKAIQKSKRHLHQGTHHPLTTLGRFSCDVTRLKRQQLIRQ